MIQEDWLLRMIEQFTQAILRLARKRDEQILQEQDVNDVLGPLIGMSLGMLDTLGSQALVQMVAYRFGEIDVGRSVGVAEILDLSATLASPEVAHQRRLKALCLLQEAHRHRPDSELHRAIEDLQTRVDG